MNGEEKRHGISKSTQEDNKFEKALIQEPEIVFVLLSINEPTNRLTLYPSPIFSKTFLGVDESNERREETQK